MSCEQHREKITAYLDGDLSGLASAELEGHLDQCPECRALAQKLGLGLEVYLALESARPEPELPAGLADMIAAQAVQEMGASPRPQRRRLIAAVAGFILAIGIFAGYQMRPHLSQPIASEPPNINLTAIRFESKGVGVEIKGESFVLHSKDKQGKAAVDLKF